MRLSRVGAVVNGSSMEDANKDERRALLIEVINNIRSLSSNPKQAEAVFGSIRNAALRPTPDLPFVARVLSRVSALAISSKDERVRRVCAVTAASLVSCLARTAGAERAGVYLEGICRALKDIHAARSRGSKRPIGFLEEFEKKCVDGHAEEGGGGMEDASPFVDDHLEIEPGRQPLLAIIGLLRRSMPVAHAFMHHSADQAYAGAMWVSLPEAARVAVAMQLSHPVLLTGCQGFQAASDAACLLEMFVENVGQSAVAKVQMRDRVGVSFCFHAGAGADLSEERQEVVVILLGILRRVAGKGGVCPRVWAEGGVKAVVRGERKVAQAAADIVADGVVANVDAHAIPEVILSPSMASKKRPRVASSAADGGASIRSTYSAFNVSSITNLSFTLCDINADVEPKPSGSELLLLRAVLEEMQSLDDEGASARRLHRFERLCFLTVNRGGLWRKAGCHWAWRRVAVQLLARVANVLQQASISLTSGDCSEIFALCRSSLELLHAVARVSLSKHPAGMDVDSGAESQLRSRSTRISESSKEEVGTWSTLIVVVLEVFEKVIAGGDAAFSLVDVGQIPFVVRLLAQFGVEEKSFQRIVPSGLLDNVYFVCTGLLEKGMQVIEVPEKRDRLVKLLGCYPTMVLSCPLAKITDAKASAERLKQLVVSFKDKSVALQESCLVALAHCVRISAKYRGDHQSASQKQFRPAANDDVWNTCHSVYSMFSAPASGGGNHLMEHSVKLLAYLALHAPTDKREKCWKALIGSAWHPSADITRRVAMTASVLLLPSHDVSNNDSSRMEIDSSRRGPQDSWDGPTSALRGSNSQEDFTTLFGRELQWRISKSELRSDATNSTVDTHPDSLIQVARLSSSSIAVGKLSAMALDALVTGAANDLHQIKAPGAAFSSSQMADDVLSMDRHLPPLKFWNALLFAASPEMDNPRSVRTDAVLRWAVNSARGDLPVASKECPVMRCNRSNAPRKRASISELANFLSCRMKDWLPLTLERMVSNPVLSKFVSMMLLETEVHLWKKVPRIALGTFLREGNLKMLDFLAERLQRSKRSLVEMVCADAIARSALMADPKEDLKKNASNNLIEKTMNQSLDAIIRKREGKIVQRVVMELGGVRDSAARRALDWLTRILSRVSPEELVSRHFLLVMDAADRVLLYENASEPERIRCLYMLKAVFQIAKESLRMYTPKVFATLKTCMNDTAASAVFKGATVDAWVALLSSLGEHHLAPHLGSMLALLLPQVQNHSEKIAPVLRKLIRDGQHSLQKVFPEILLLFRTVTHPSLQDVTKFLEENTGGSSMDVDSGIDCAGKKFEKTCLQFLNVATRHESPEIRLIALDQLLEVLRSNRSQMETLLDSLKTAEQSDAGAPPLLAVLVHDLLSLVSESMEGCDMRALECLGELGAIDPALVVPHLKSWKRKDRALESKRPGLKAEDRKLPNNALSLARFLLEVHLAPALWRSDRQDAVGSRLNRVGLAIQELLKACGCNRETAMRAKPVSEVIDCDADEPLANWTPRRNGQSGAGDCGVAFWKSLSEPVRTAAHPYLLEPFDVQTYASVIGSDKKGDIEAACVSVWDKLKFDGKSAPPVEDWRRQVVFQAIDFLGGEGNYGALFRAVRPALRYEHGIVSSIFPHVVMMALDFERALHKSNHLCTFVVSELKMALQSESTVIPGIFSLLDVLRSWWYERATAKGIAACQIHRKRAQKNNSKNRGPPSQYFVQVEREKDTLLPLVDLHGGTNTSISLFRQAKAALSARAYARAVMLAEQHIRNLRDASGNEAWPSTMANLLGANLVSSSLEESPAEFDENESLSVLQRAYAALEGADSLKDVAALRRKSTFAESIIDAEASGNFDDALLTYERAISQNPTDEELHIGLLRCLCTLGHWETMLAHGSGLSLAASPAAPNSESSRKKTRSLAVEAAWRLGRWDHLDEICTRGTVQDSISQLVCGDDADICDTGEAIGRTLLNVQRKHWEVAGVAVKQTRAALLPHVAHAALEGHFRAYPMLVQLHALADVEDLAQVARKRATEQSQIGDSQEAVLELTRMNCRSSAASVSLRVREPLLSTRRACLEMLGYKSLAANVSIELAQLARESGNVRAATAAATHALTNTEPGDATFFAGGTEMARIQRLRGDDAGALKYLKKVIDGMTRAHDLALTGGTSRNEGRRLAGGHPDQCRIPLIDGQERLCAAHVLAGKWIEDSRSESSDAILSHYTRATQYCPQSDEAFYSLGRYYDSLLQARVSGENGVDGRYGGRHANSQGSAGSGSNRIRRNYFEYVPLVIQNFSKALQEGHGRLFDALPRLLTVFFNYYSDRVKANHSGARVHAVEPLVRRAINTAFVNIPPYMWMSVIPQLSSRLLHEDDNVRKDVTGLLARLLVRFPDQCIWLIIPATQLNTQGRKNAAKDVMTAAINMAKRVRGGAKKASADDKARAKLAGQTLRTLILRGQQVVKDLIDVSMMPSKLGKKGGGFENCSHEFAPIKDNLETSSVIVPTLRALTVRLPGVLNADKSGGVGNLHRAFAEEPVLIDSIEDEVLVMSSLMQPKRVGFLGSDGRRYRFLAKRETNGDMRKDSRLMDFVTVVNRLLAKDRHTRERDLHMKTYAVIPLTEETGMIEWVNDLAPLRSLVKEETNVLGEAPSNVVIIEKYAKVKSKRAFLEDWAIVKFPPMLDRFFLRKFARDGDAGSWLTARTTWTRTVAVWSMTGYIVGLGDRHAENILVETTSGRAIHVDFAMLFDKGQSLKVPECTPFRLTPNMVGAFGIAGTEGAFRVACEATLQVLRAGTDGLMGTLESFLHDPMADWNKSGNRYALETRYAVHNKLRGLVDGSGIALSIQGQVQKLIADATNLDKLAEMYIWWSAWT